MIHDTLWLETQRWEQVKTELEHMAAIRSVKQQIEAGAKVVQYGLGSFLGQLDKSDYDE